MFFSLFLEMFNDPENLKLNLDRCMRFLPHHNDDGGFFVAILRKTKDVEGKVHHVMKDSRKVMPVSRERGDNGLFITLVPKDL